MRGREIGTGDGVDGVIVNENDPSGLCVKKSDYSGSTS